ncbi:YeiH family protein [Nocardioides marmotae]|uniref:YeiH family protein n=1 Tax=Nocardioides marmotae TaxID=2663857 RepID=UPI0012B528DA|nr:putative sulfate exporter family transporter [Nocardioides marmotae]MBC9732723.1 putative sulfate exporter family transporter [Nocardioides marmotae]MTB83840.1 putative sulfate exporter family transporter [Nocardioides marmotae]
MVDRRVPGLALAAAAGGAALAVHALVPGLGSTLVAVLLGFAAAASGRLPEAVRPGLATASRTVLRVGVALLGLQLVLADVLGLGWPVVAVVVGVVALGIAGTLLAARLLGVPPEQGLLVACGFSICGAAAVAALDGVRRGRAEDVARVVALVVVCGSAAMLAVPLLGSALGLSPVAAGAWAGASVHEVGQVVVAGGLLGSAALQVAVAVKLGRVLLLAPVLAVVAVRARRETEADTATATEGVRRPPLVPGFVLAFVGLVALRTLVPLPDVALDAAAQVQSAALATAMFALGCSLDPAALRRTRRRLVALAAVATGVVALLGLPAAYLVG